jgi:endonuclease V-like protein UPF0215 family
MKNLHLEKIGIRGLAIAESFKQGDKFSTLAGIVMRRDLIIDGFVFGHCTIEGDDSTSAILDIYSKLGRDDISFFIISGLVISMYNIVSIKKIFEETRLPVIGVTYEESSGLEGAIMHHFPAKFDKKLEQYYNLGARNEVNLHTGHKLHIRTEGCSYQDASKILNILTLQGSIPEPLRLAKILAKAYPN